VLHRPTTHFGHRLGNMFWELGVRGGAHLPKQNRFAAAAGLALVLLCCSCASRPLQGVLVPNAQSADGASRVPILVATTRERSSRDPGELFSGERAPDVSYASIVVSIPPDSTRKVGEVQWPATLPGDPQRNFVTVSVDYLGDQSFSSAFPRKRSKRDEAKFSSSSTASTIGLMRLFIG
jgi:hypothetical protein